MAVAEEQKTEKKGRTKSVAYLFLAANENLRKSVAKIIDGLTEGCVSLFRTKNQYEVVDSKLGPIEMQIAGGEDITRELIKVVDAQTIGITGSDFVIEALLASAKEEAPFYQMRRADLRTGEFTGWREISALNPRTGKSYTLPKSIIGKGIEEGTTLEFRAQDGKIVRMKVLPNAYGDTDPWLCFLGAKNPDFPGRTPEAKMARYRQILEIARQEGGLRVRAEERFGNIAKDVLEHISSEEDVTYYLDSVTRKTEGWIEREFQQVRSRRPRAHLALEIAQSLKTADDNELVVYGEPIVPSLFAEVVCYHEGDGVGPISLEDISKAIRAYRNEASSTS